jgi:pimeloyl-ACP methyl ester carboxylesterase
MRNLWRDWGIPFQDIKIPVFLWHGDADDLAPTHLARYLAAQIPGCTAVFYTGEDHTGPLMKHRQEILRALKDAYEAAS